MHGRASLSKTETSKLQMKYLFLRGAIDISVYLKKSFVQAILSSSGTIGEEILDMNCVVWSSFDCLAFAVLSEL